MSKIPALEIAQVEFAILHTGGANLGRCYNQYNYLVICSQNPQDTTYDDVMAKGNRSADKMQRIWNVLPVANAGCELSKFQYDADTGKWFATYWYRVDSGD